MMLVMIVIVAACSSGESVSQVPTASSTSPSVGPELTETTILEGGPDYDWVRISARSDLNSFTILVPAGWKFKNLQGIDSLVGNLTNGEITLSYDFGAFSGRPYSSSYRILDDVPNPPHIQWKEDLLAGDFEFVRPETPVDAKNAVTGALIKLANPKEPNLPLDTASGPMRLSFRATGLDNEEQETVLAMFRTVQLEPNIGLIKQ